MEFIKNKFNILQGNCIDVLKTLPDNYIQTCITSPPYYGLRDYGTATWVGGDPNCNHYRDNKCTDETKTCHRNMMENGFAIGDAIYKTVCPKCGAIRVDEQIGLEETPKEYIQKLVDVFHEVKRVLKDDGILWVNIGDSYAVSQRQNNNFDYIGGVRTNNNDLGKNNFDGTSIKPKDLIGIPWMLAFALRNDGWYLRQDIIWHKPNPMPESVKDRFTKSHEYIFMLTKSPHYYFNHEMAQEPANPETEKRYKYPMMVGAKEQSGGGRPNSQSNTGGMKEWTGMRNKRDVWNINVASYRNAHFATFPTKLIEPCILCGSKEEDIVLDPFNGSGTTGEVSILNQRKYIGIELNQDYIDLSMKRLMPIASQKTIFDI